MPITTTFDADKPTESIMRMLVEFLRDTNCFDSDANAIANVMAYTTVDQTDMPIPRVEIALFFGPRVSTGAGRQSANAFFTPVEAELTIKRTKKDNLNPAEAERDIIRTYDIFEKYFRSSDGYPKLGAAKLRKANLAGPINATDKNYYQLKAILSMEVEVS